MTDQSNNRFKLRREGTLLKDIAGLPEAFVNYMHSRGIVTVESAWCAMHAVPDAFKRDICPRYQMDAKQLEITLRQYVSEEMRKGQFKITGDVWSTESLAQNPDEIGFNLQEIPREGNVYINLNDELPKSVTIPAGCCLAFVRHAGLCGGSRLKKGPAVPAQDFLKIMLPVKNNRVDARLPGQPARTTLAVLFKAKAAPGTFGEIEMQFAPSNPMCDPYPPVKVSYFID